MSQKEVIYSIKIDGQEVAVKNATDVSLAISEIQKQMKLTNDDKSFKALEKELIKLKALRKIYNKEVNESVKQAQAELVVNNKNLGEYDKMVITFRALKARIKEVQAQGGIVDDKDIADVKRMSSELIKIENSVGEFQREVGKYPKIVTAIIPGFDQIKNSLEEVGSSAGLVGKGLAAGFAGFAVLNIIGDQVTDLKNYVNEFRELRGEIGKLTGATGKELDMVVAQSSAITKTFGADAQQLRIAANTVAKEFGVPVSEAMEMISKGYLAGADTNNEFLDVLRMYPTFLASSGASLEQFIAIQTKLTKEGIYSDKGIDAIKEFSIRIKEQTTATREALVDAFGSEFTDDLFKGINNGSVKVVDALGTISEGIKTLDEKRASQVLADVFGGAGEDAGRRAIEALSGYNDKLGDLIDLNDQYTSDQLDILSTNQAFADAQNEVTKSMEGSVIASSNLGTKMKTFGLNLVNFAVKGIDRFIDPARVMREELAEQAKAVNDIDREVTGLVDRYDALMKITEPTAEEQEELRRIIQEIGKVTPEAITQIDNYGKVLGISSEKAREFNKLNKEAVKFAKESAIKQTEIEITNLKFRKRLLEQSAREGELFEGSISKIFGNSLTKQLGEIGQLAVQIDELGTSLNDLNKVEVNVAFSTSGRTAFGQRKTGGKLAGEEAAKKKAEQDKKDADARLKEAQKRAKARAKEREKEAVQAAKDREKQAEEIATSDDKLNDDRLKLLRVLSAKLIDAQIANIGNEKDRIIAAENQKHRNRIAEIKDLNDKLLAKVAEHRDKLIKLYGEDSQQVIDFTTKSAQYKLAVESDSNRLIEEEAVLHKARLSGINRDYNAKETKKRLEDIKKRLFEVQDTADRATNILKGELASGKIKADVFDDKLFDLQKGEIVQGLEVLSAKAQQFGIAMAFGGESLSKEMDEVLRQTENLNTQLAQLEEDRTAKVQVEAQKRAEERAAEFERVLGQVSEGLSIADSFFENVSERNIQRSEREVNQRNENISNLEERLATATAIEKFQIEEKIKNEKKALVKAQKETEAIEKKEAKRQKAFAITQSIIAGTLAVTRALASFPAPNVPAAVLAGVLAAANTAAIIAQPLATGGVVGKNVLGQDIQSLPNGDNVLTTLRRGELVLNENQQIAANRLFGGNIFGAVGVPNAGGVPFSDPALSAPNAGASNGVLEVAMKLAEATNNRIDKLKTFVTLEDIEEVQEENNLITTNAELSN